MALKSRFWFLGGVLDLERYSPIEQMRDLARLALDLGLKGEDGTRGHVLQACGAIQKFFDVYPAHIATMQAELPAEPYNVPPPVLQDWINFFLGKNGTYGHPNFAYDYNILRGYLTHHLGGNRVGGGGGDHEFRICLRLIPEL